MLTLYAMPESGNCWKVAWMLRLCKVPHRIVVASYDGSNGSLKTRSPDFLEKNPNGQTPLLELEDGGRRLAESNAILLYLAEKHVKMMPTTSDDPYQRALVYQWLFFEQYSHEPYIAVRRANLIFDRPRTDATMQALLEKGRQALRVMDHQLRVTAYLTGDEATVADIALYAYTHLAHEGGFDLKDFPAVAAWLERIKSLPDFAGLEIMQQESYSPS